MTPMKVGKSIWDYDFRVDPSHETFVWLVWEINVGGTWCLRGCASTESIAKRQSKMAREIGEVHNQPRKRIHIERVLVDHLFGASMFNVYYSHEIEDMLKRNAERDEMVEKEKKDFLEHVRKVAIKRGILDEN